MSRVLLSLLCASCAAAMLALLPGCQTPLTFAQPAASWLTYTGQMHYTNSAGRAVIGEFVARRPAAGSDLQLQFASGPGFPLLKFAEAGDTAQAEGLFARGSWHGRVSGAPPNLRSWLRLREVFAALRGTSGTLRGEGWTAEARASDGRVTDLIVSFPQASERFAFHFSP